MIRVYHYDAGTKTAGCPDAAKLPATAADLPPESVVWIDLEDPTPEEEARVFTKFLAAHPLTLEDATRPRREPDRGAHLPKVEEFPAYLLVIANPLPWEACAAAEAVPTPPPRKWSRPQLTGVLTHNVLVTHHYDRLPCVDAVRGHVDRRGDRTERGPDYLFHLILDEMVDEYAPVVDRFAERLDKIESLLFRKPSPKILKRLLQLKRQIIFLRKTLVLEREVLARLTRGEFSLVGPHEVAYYRNVYDHLVRYTELIEGAREMVSDLMQTHLSAASNRLNEVMKVLTMISTIILPMTLISGIYGMNFEYIPALKTEWGFYMSLGMMAVTAVAGFALFRWKRWI